MRKYLTYGVILLVTVVVGYLIVSNIVNSATQKRATLMLAEIVSNYDDEYGDIAARALIAQTPENALAKLAEGLDSSKTGCKVRIVNVLDAYEGDIPFDLLVQSVGDEDIYVSSVASLALARRQHPEILDLAKDRLGHADHVIAGINYEIVANFEDDLISTIEEQLNNYTISIQPYSIRGLVPSIQRGNERAWMLLKRALDSGSVEVHTAAFETAVSLGGEHRVETLRICVESPDANLRAKALREIADGDDTSLFMDELKLALNGAELEVVFNASWGLLKLRDPEPVAILRSIVRDKDVSDRDRIIASRLLARLGATEGADPMYGIIDSVTISEEVKLEAAEVLGEYEDIKGLGILGEAIKSDKPREIRTKALTLLGLMGDKIASTMLVDMLSDADDAIAVRAAYALAALGDKRGLRALKRYLRSDSTEVRTIAAVGIVTGGDIHDIVGDEGYS